jgi:hypothetical protein
MTAATAPAPGAIAANVLFLRMRGWMDEPRPRQEERRDRLLELARAAIEGWAAPDRVVLEAPGGLAIVGCVPPSVALQAARHVAGEGDDAQLAIALHQGPVRALGDEQAPRVQGDGIDTAAALASFAGTQPIVASRDFREALALQSPREAENLRAAGEMVDDRLRAHDLFVFDPAPAHARATRRQVMALLGLVGLLGAGVAGREARDRWEEAHRPAILQLDIRPTGELYVDGERKGTVPPLVRVSVPPGPHTIEVRNGRFKPVKMDVELSPGEELQVKHVFAMPPSRPSTHKRKHEPGLLDRLKFW